MSNNDPLLQVRDLKKHFPIQKGLFRRQVDAVRAIDGLTFDIHPGETLALVGEKDSGKSTTGRTILHLLRPTSGRVLFNGQDLTKMGQGDLRKMRQQMQIIFHDPYTTLNPRLTVQRLLEEPLAIHDTSRNGRAGRKQRVEELLTLVGLNPYHAGRVPHEFSGSHRQRINLARALATNPSLLVADEPLAALDVTVHSYFIELLHSLKQTLGLSYLLLAADLATVRTISDRVAILHAGRIVELGSRDGVLERPLHPYTHALRSAVPLADAAKESRRQRLAFNGEAGHSAGPLPACHYLPRCPYASDLCRQTEPPLRDLGTATQPHWVACHHAEQFQQPTRWHEPTSYLTLDT
jgi:oligopeptide/dipeptide ABC transporter ATP-binding protein